MDMIMMLQGTWLILFEVYNMSKYCDWVFKIKSLDVTRWMSITEDHFKVHPPSKVLGEVLKPLEQKTCSPTASYMKTHWMGTCRPSKIGFTHHWPKWQECVKTGCWPVLKWRGTYKTHSRFYMTYVEKVDHTIHIYHHIPRLEDGHQTSSSLLFLIGIDVPVIYPWYLDSHGMELMTPHVSHDVPRPWRSHFRDPWPEKWSTKDDFPAWNLSLSDFCWSFLGNHRLIPYSIKVQKRGTRWSCLRRCLLSISTQAGNLQTFWTLVAVEGFADFWAVCSEDSKDGFGLVVGWCSLEGSRAFPLRLVISTLETQQFRCETRKKQDRSRSAPKLYISDWPLKGKTLTVENSESNMLE